MRHRAVLTTNISDVAGAHGPVQTLKDQGVDMCKPVDLNKCISFIKSGFLQRIENTSLSPVVRPTVTISRMTGSGGHTVASNLADYLQATLPDHGDWAVFDRNLVEKILEEHHLHKRVADFMKEDHKTMFTDVVEELIGLHPGGWTLLQKTNATILHLAQMGNVILVGRGACVVAAKVRNALHVRLVGSLDKRVKWVEHTCNVDTKAALQFIKKGDEGRRRYLKDNFDKDVDDPLLYHMVINTDIVSHEEAARMIGNELIRRFNLDRQAKMTGSRQSAIQ